MTVLFTNFLSVRRIRGAFVSLTMAAAFSSAAIGAVATRHYDFEEGTAGDATSIVADSMADLFIESDETGIWPGGHIWLEVSGNAPRPLPTGPLVDIVDEWALADPVLEAFEGEGTFFDVSDGTAMDSPAVNSTLALRFDGNVVFDDFDLGSRGVYIERDAYNNNDDSTAENQAESFNLISQGWVYPSSDGQGSLQTVWQAGTEQGSVNITEDGFWEFRELSAAGDLNPGIEVAFDTWTHLGIRRGGNGAEVFINGEQVDGEFDPETPNFFGGFATRISLGGKSEDAGIENGFIGLVDDFKIVGTADLAWDPTVDLDYWASNTNPGGGCTPTNDLLGDLDGEGGVAFADFLIMSENFGTQVGSYAEGDIDCDGEVAFSDFLVLSENFGQTLGAAAAVPEPSGIALLFPATLLFLLLRKRR